jgi:hypothetical protein
VVVEDVLARARVLVAVAIVAWIKFRPGRAGR